MAVYERNMIVRHKDENGDTILEYPATKIKNVIGASTVLDKKQNQWIATTTGERVTAENGTTTVHFEVTLDPAPTELYKGMIITILPHMTVSSEETAYLNVNGLGEKAIRQKTYTGTTTYVQKGTYSLNRPIILQYNGTYWLDIMRPRPRMIDIQSPSHASAETTYGAGNDTLYGHTKLSDAINSDLSVSGGTAATPAAVKAVMENVQRVEDKLSYKQAKTTVVVGITTSGHTENDCDYLCDGDSTSSTQSTIKNAIETLIRKGGGRLLFLKGIYPISIININFSSFSSTVKEQAGDIIIEGMGKNTTIFKCSDIDNAKCPSRIILSRMPIDIIIKDIGFQGVCFNFTLSANIIFDNVYISTIIGAFSTTYSSFKMVHADNYQNPDNLCFLNCKLESDRDDGVAAKNRFLFNCDISMISDSPKGFSCGSLYFCRLNKVDSSSVKYAIGNTFIDSTVQASSQAIVKFNRFSVSESMVRAIGISFAENVIVSSNYIQGKFSNGAIDIFGIEEVNKVKAIEVSDNIIEGDGGRSLAVNGAKYSIFKNNISKGCNIGIFDDDTTNIYDSNIYIEPESE